MTSLEQLQAYLRQLQQRLRLFAASRGAAIIGGLALGLTLLLVWISNRYQFAHGVVLPLRILLFLSIGVAIALALAVPLLKLNRRWVTRLAEQRIPDFEQRLLTVSERPDPSNPFTELVAEDALRVAHQHQPEELTPSRSLFALAASGGVTAAVLIWLILAGPGYWGYGAGLLWTGNANASKRPLYDIAVQPGNKTIRRKSDQLISAHLLGFSAHKVSLHAKYGGALKWEETAMQPAQDGNSYRFLFAGLSDAVEYYVQADGAQSKHFKLGVKDLPGVKRVRVALHYPAGLGLRDATFDPGGDIRAVEGTQADIAILTDRPLEHGVLVLENGTRINLTHGDGNWLAAHLSVTKDGSYHIAAIDNGEAVRISDDYFIEAKKDEPPSIRIARPGRDPHVSPIEEMPVTVEAADDFGVDGMELHYSVNGGAEQVVPLLKSKGVKDAQGGTTLYLENFKLVPGDLVSMYATAKDAKTTARSDIIFAQAEPFDFKFSQSQQAGAGGGMGMGNQQANISERQKQIIAATWNELKSDGKTHATIQEDARFLSELEGKLGEQAKTLAERMGSRELSSANSEFEQFSKLMTQASSQMDDAVGRLKPAKWHDALSPEQMALQSLLRAEAIFRNIQVAFGQAGGGQGGGGAQRDLARMFDLELDTTKNQYETGQSNASQQNDQQKAIDEAFQRLQMLARRQQELAAQNAQQQAFEQRWQEEQLRREAEELRRQIEQLAQNTQGQQQQQQQANGQQSGQQGGQQGSSSSSSSSSSQSARQGGQQNRQMNEAMRHAMESLKRAEDQMRQAVSNHDATAEQRAAQELADAQTALNNALHQQAGSSVSDLAQRSQEIANAQRDIANKLKQMYGGDSLRNRMESEFGSAENPGGMPQMNDPDGPSRFPWGYRRRYWQQMQPTRPATEQEKAIAGQKEKLAQQLEQLEKQMQQQTQNLAGTQPDASSKMRRALSEAEQKELALRMQKNAEWIRQGYGDRNIGMEDSVTAGLDQLSRDLRGVQQALNSGNPNGQNGRDEKTERTMAQLRSLREQLERAQQGNRSGQSGQQPGQNGQQQGAQQNGQQAGQNGQQGGQQNGQAGSPQNGTPQNGTWSAYGGGGTFIDRQSIHDAINQLNTFRGQIDPRDHALNTYFDGTLGYLHDLYADPSQLQSTIGQDAVTSLERLEIELNRRLGVDLQRSGGARTGAAEPSPEKYRDAVAEYFKKLSQPQ